MSTILLLSLLILVHELGHFFAAKKFGVKVEEFGIGIPPKALRLFKKGETEYTLNWLPLGGFVRLYGEDGDVSWWEKLNPLERRRTLGAKPAWQRLIIMAAGVIMNLLTGIILFAIIYTHVGVPVVTEERVVVTEVVSGSPASDAGIAAGDVMVRVGEWEVTDSGRFVELVGEQKGRTVDLYVGQLASDGTVKDGYRVVTVMPRLNPPEGEGALGVGIAEVPIVRYEKKSWYTAPFYGAVEGVKEAYGWTRVMLSFFAHPTELWQGLSGPVEVVKVGQQQAAEGWISFLRFGGIISFNLAVFNMLPLPALDGGRIMLLGLEKVIGRKRVARIEPYVNGVGMIMLLLLMVVVTVRDLIK